MSTTHYLFPTPVFETHINRGFTKEEMNFVKNVKCYTNISNSISKDVYILENKNFKNIKKFVQKCCNEYVDKILAPKNKIEIYITQSWLNFTHQNEAHHSHEHQNSFISGVFYIHVNSDLDTIEFFKRDYEFFKIEQSTFNNFNSTSWGYPVKNGQLMLFPSSTIHGVKSKKHTDVRCSLAFNTFIKGDFGNDKSLTKLEI
jgi:uncharacterized protein (TIGR02466 family)|tara:strand:- start:8 stop:610 length:603 start_codon:yes stop_codon:yes gene_type:complete